MALNLITRRGLCSTMPGYPNKQAEREEGEAWSNLYGIDYLSPYRLL